MTGFRSKSLAILRAVFVSFFTGSWPRVLAYAAPLPTAPAVLREQGQQGKNEGKHAEEMGTTNDSDDRDVESASSIQEGAQIEEDRQEGLQEGLQGPAERQSNRSR